MGAPFCYETDQDIQCLSPMAEWEYYSPCTLRVWIPEAKSKFTCNLEDIHIVYVYSAKRS